MKKLKIGCRNTTEYSTQSSEYGTQTHTTRYRVFSISIDNAISENIEFICPACKKKFNVIVNKSKILTVDESIKHANKAIVRYIFSSILLLIGCAGMIYVVTHFAEIARILRTNFEDWSSIVQVAVGVIALFLGLTGIMCFGYFIKTLSNRSKAINSVKRNNYESLSPEITHLPGKVSINKGHFIFMNANEHTNSLTFWHDFKMDDENIISNVF
jgi:hypothetical protein